MTNQAQVIPAVFTAPHPSLLDLSILALARNARPTGAPPIRWPSR
jgi:hypothetical protein